MLGTLFELHYAGASDVGYVRKNNEDAWIALPDLGLFALADGMGGQHGGEIAARTCVSQLALYMQKQLASAQLHSLQEMTTLLTAAINYVNHCIYEKSELEPRLKGMGTTLCSLWCLNNLLLYAHVGDSRIYHYSKDKLKLLTQDHSLVNELIALGDITQEESLTSSYKHVLTRAVGIHPYVESSISHQILSSGDLFLLCSDGLTNYASEKDIKNIFKTASLHRLDEERLKIAAAQLISLAKSNGGGDNITVVLISALERAS